ncbi:MAG: radical SAM protein [Anaerolineae bacterium]
MANLVITKFCQRHCEYCFTPSEWRELISPEQGMMTLDEFDEACAFLRGGDRPSLSLLGGEPTTHPQFPLFVDHALSAGFAVRVVTNGEIPAQHLVRLCRFDRDQVTLLVNLSSNIRGVVHLTPRQRNTLKQAGSLISLSFTIGQEQPDVSSWIDLVTTYGLHPHIRIGIAHPSPRMQNRSLLPRDRYRVGETLVQIARQLDEKGINLGLDCGLTPCMFTEDSWQELRRLSAHSSFACGPIPDIGPGLEAWHCFPLYDLGHCKLTDFATLAEVNAWLSGLTAAYRLIGIREECISCPYQLRKECSGGCLGHVIASFDQPDRLRA